jgi:membrane fusion protein (multidrug efflux system)
VNRRGAFLLIATLVGAALGRGAPSWLRPLDGDSPDDAFLDATVVHVSADVAGRVRRVAVADDEDVEPGELLLEIDPADFELRCAEARALSAEARARVAQAEAQLAVAEAQALEARAGIAIAEAKGENAAAELRRHVDLRAANAGAVSQQQLDAATSAAKSTAAQVTAATTRAAAADAQARFAASQIQSARAALESADAAVERAKRDLAATAVKATGKGRVTRRVVARGDRVAAGEELMTLVSRTVSVTATFRETQLQRLREGQPAEIAVVAYPETLLRGHLERIEAGCSPRGSARVTARIVFDEQPDPRLRLGPGMSVLVRVK